MTASKPRGAIESERAAPPQAPSAHRSHHSFASDWIEASGEAVVHSWTVAHHPFHPAFRAELPYTLVTADLPEGVRLLAQLRGSGPDALRPGARLRLDYEDTDRDLTLPVFRLLEG